MTRLPTTAAALLLAASGAAAQDTDTTLQPVNEPFAPSVTLPDPTPITTTGGATTEPADVPPLTYIPRDYARGCAYVAMEDWSGAPDAIFDPGCPPATQGQIRADMRQAWIDAKPASHADIAALTKAVEALAAELHRNPPSMGR